MDPQMLGLNGFANNPNWVLDAGRDYPRLAWQGTPGEVITEPDIDWFEGSGLAQDPYQIFTAEQLILLGKTSILTERNFVLSADIDLDPNLADGRIFPQAVIPVFMGVFDGNSHVISNLVIEGGSQLGLFGRLETGAEVKNLGVVDVNVVGSGNYVGGLVGFNPGVVTRCHSTGTVIGGDDYVGGLVGDNGYSGVVSDCYSMCTVSGSGTVGGLVGRHRGNVTQCYSAGAVSGDNYVGGLVGHNYYSSKEYSGTVDYCNSMCTVSGDKCVGGLVGDNESDATHCYSTGSVIGDEDIGGLVGVNTQSGTVTQCYSTGTVDGNDMVGGLVGDNSSGELIQCHSTGMVDGNDMVGGLVGYNFFGDVTQCYSTGTVDGNDTVGGLVGSNSFGDVIQSCSTGAVSGDDYVGGLVGHNGYFGSVVSNCYSMGMVRGNSDVGGLVGYNFFGDVTQCYSTGSVNGDEDVGGLMGNGSGAVLLLDTKFLEQNIELTKAQVSAIKCYNKVKNKYQNSKATEEFEIEAQKAEVRQAQADLLKAFPNLKLVTVD